LHRRHDEGKIRTVSILMTATGRHLTAISAWNEVFLPSAAIAATRH
jgi:hypothetical protein